jgi:hypothetical protein
LAAVRDPASLAVMSPADRKAWQALWRDVDARLDQPANRTAASKGVTGSITGKRFLDPGHCWTERAFSQDAGWKIGLSMVRRGGNGPAALKGFQRRRPFRWHLSLVRIHRPTPCAASLRAS